MANEFKADELTLWSSAPVIWPSVADSPGAYEAFFPSLFEVTSDLSLYQSLLPRDLQLKEFLQMWLKDETIPLALQRLRNSTPAVVNASFATGGTA
jgi:ATP-dependent Lhr-like helicase